MEIVTIITSIIFGCAIGIALALLVMNFLVYKSNSIGDSKGDFRTFTLSPLRIVSYQDKLKESEIPKVRNYIHERNRYK